MIYTAYISLTLDEAAQLHYAVERRQYPILSVPSFPPPAHRASAKFLQLALPWQRFTQSKQDYTTYKLIVTDIHDLPRHFTAYLRPSKIRS